MLPTLFINCANVYQTIVSWLAQNMLPCGFKYFFGIDCPGCGLQRSIILLLQGNVWASIQMYPPLLPTVFVLALHFFNKRIKYEGQTYFFKLIVWSVAGLIAINFLYKFAITFLRLI